MLLDFVGNPFDLPNEVDDVKGYVRPLAAVNAAIGEQVDAIFSYKSPLDPDLLDTELKRWSERNGDLSLRELDIRSGTGLVALGFCSDAEQLIGIVTPGYAMGCLARSFEKETDGGSRFLLSVGALEYNEDTGALVCDYIKPLEEATRLGLPVVTPLSWKELRATTLLTAALAKFGKAQGAVHLYDALTYSKSVVKIPESKKRLKLADFNIPKGSSVEDIVARFNQLYGLDLGNFQYYGDSTAETVFVLNGSVEGDLFASMIQDQTQVGLIAVRIPSPFNGPAFVKIVPESATNIVVIGQCQENNTYSWLKSTISAALFYSNKRNIRVSEYIFHPDFFWSPNAVVQILNEFDYSLKLGSDTESKDFIYWSSDYSSEIDVPARLVHALSLIDGVEVTMRTKFDNFTNAGIFQAQFSVNPVGVHSVVSNIDSSNVTFVEDINILRFIDIAGTVRDNGTIILVSRKSLKGIDLQDQDTLVDQLQLPTTFLDTVRNKRIKLVFLDADAIGEREDTKHKTLSFVYQAVFWRFAYGYDIQSTVRAIWSSAGADIELLAAVIADLITDSFQKGLIEVPVVYKKSNTVADASSDSPSSQLPIFMADTAAAPNPRDQKKYPEFELGNAQIIAKKIAFKEAYGVTSEIRPDLSMNNFIVKVKENRRVTPTDYERYIFHIEFDISGTGLKYEIGDALGIHARNNEESVKSFLHAYRLKEDGIIVLPSKNEAGYLESRTVLQVFVENLDIFGKPSKRFYEGLVEFAEDEAERLKLQHLVSPAGASELKRFQDEEYYTYVDIFDLFPSARPPLDRLIELIAPLKRREYSIASSQRVHPNELHLLIVVVDWVDRRGRKRYGHTSKYLSELMVGTEIVVSVKPSVMKLPASPLQPIIMSGLGTGLAPFKALVEEKAWQKSQGQDIGGVYLFMGSRHKREEYLYGELWEAYKDAGIITHIGAAFSRDQPHKIYIQDRIREVLHELSTALIEKEGTFYLCGPTWPVPDITQVLKDIIAADAASRNIEVDLDAAIEELKETSKYILEVY
ncbi:FAGR237Cp [Eremothecium gossypii FDAG1]|nr:FAGR237Cp [Eremothecium gossypii FDAG1]